MGKIRKRADGKWIVDFRLPLQIARKYRIKRFRRPYGTNALARKVHGIVSAAISLNDPDGIIGRLLMGKVDDDEPAYTVKTFYDRWIGEYCKPRLEATTLTRYKLSFKTINEFCGSMPLQAFTRSTLHGYIQSRDEKVSQSTINKDIIACKKMFSYAAEVGALDHNPLVKFPALRIQEKALRLPTPEEFKALLEAMPDPAIAAMVAIMGETGIRRSEAINLKWENVNLRTGRLTLERTKGKRVRTVPLSPSAVNALRGLLRFVNQPRVFCHQLTGKPWLSPDKAFREGRQEAKLDWITFHTLRHMRATKWLQLGVDIRTVQGALGHASVQTTQRYTKNIESFAERAIREAQEIEQNEEQEAKEEGSGSK